MVVQVPDSVVDVWWFRSVIAAWHVDHEASKRVQGGSVHIQLGTCGIEPRHEGDEVVVDWGQVPLAHGGLGNMLSFEFFAWVVGREVGNVEQALDDAVLGGGIF